VPWWKTWRSEKSFSLLGGGGDIGGGRKGTWAALARARKGSSREAVTRKAEVQRGRRRIVSVWCEGEGGVALLSVMSTSHLIDDAVGVHAPRLHVRGPGERRPGPLIARQLRIETCLETYNYTATATRRCLSCFTPPGYLHTLVLNTRPSHVACTANPLLRSLPLLHMTCVSITTCISVRHTTPRNVHISHSHYVCTTEQPASRAIFHSPRVCAQDSALPIAREHPPGSP
jgi:hypothetical protein